MRWKHKVTAAVLWIEFKNENKNKHLSKGAIDVFFSQLCDLHITRDDLFKSIKFIYNDVVSHINGLAEFELISEETRVSWIFSIYEAIACNTTNYEYMLKIRDLNDKKKEAEDYVFLNYSLFSSNKKD